MTLLHWPECDVWRMTPYKIMTLFRIHREFHPDQFKPDRPQGMENMDDIDIALGGL